MVIPGNSVKISFQEFKNVLFFSNIQPWLPSDAILIEMLKPLEEKLQSAPSMRKFRQESFYPLWFMAETERNVYLWRNSFSIGQQDSFQFWISIENLIERRMHQLESFGEDNLFLSPELVANPLLFQKRQIEYLRCFQDAFEKIKEHAHALSLSGAMLEVERNGDSKGHVVLPRSRREKLEPSTQLKDQSI